MGADECRRIDFSDTILKPYIQFTGRSSPEFSKIQALLTSSSSGTLSCLICLERIKLSHSTWSCGSCCFAVFHLLCIQSWAHQASDLAAERALTLLSHEHSPVAAANALESSLWNCPKCRVEYNSLQIPKSYLCFCGKLENPPSDPSSILPHSCGEVCGKPLKNNCGHECLLLCHPGPCPLCSKLVNSRCWCEKTEEERECFERKFCCGNSCERLLGCGKHFCVERCHSGPCGVCPFQGKSMCPCGKKVFEGMACDVAAPACGFSCGKILSWGLHRCLNLVFFFTLSVWAHFCSLIYHLSLL